MNEDVSQSEKNPYKHGVAQYVNSLLISARKIISLINIVGIFSATDKPEIFMRHFLGRSEKYL